MTNNIPQETINNVLVNILRGAQDASSEIYGASKVGIIKAVDFASEQAPLVIQEFLAWKSAEAIFNIVIVSIALCFVFKFMKWSFKALKSGKPDISFALCFMSSVFLSAFLIGNVLIKNTEQLIKIKVAPRVYVIEWVSSQVKK